MKRSWADVSLARLSHNLQQIRTMVSPGCSILGIVKANAYGHGTAEVAACLAREGIREFAVANVFEAVQVRERVPEAPILVLGGCIPGEEDLFRRYQLTAALFDERPLAPDIPVEVKIDTGMGRLGIPWESTQHFLRVVPNPVRGVYSHFAAADGDPDWTARQLERFVQATAGVQARRHICNSAALSFREAHLDAVRPGISLYGITVPGGPQDVLPVLSWKTRVLTVKTAPAGSTVGYGGTYRVSRDSRIAVLPVGYADGYSRRLSNLSQVLIRGSLHSVVGRLSMDLTSVDVTADPAVEAGDEVTLLEASSASPISAQELGRLLGTISYEILTTIGNRVERVYA